MKKHNFSLLVICVVSMSLYCCSKKQNANNNLNRIYFTIPEYDRKITIPVQLSDSVIVNLTFDTGANAEGIDLDTEIFVLHPELLPKVMPDTIKSGVAWANSNNDIQLLHYDIPLTVKTGNTELNYTWIKVMDWKRYMNNPKYDGVFNIQKNDTTHIWELNFEQNYLEIHPAENFNMPEDSFILPFYFDYPFFVQLPMKLQFSDGDTLTMNPDYYFIDTGMSWDIALMHQTKDLEFFNKKDDAVWTHYLHSYYRHYNVKATIFEHFVIDSLRIYTFDYPNRIAGNAYLIGQHFLKHFNVFFDMKNKRLGLQPIKNFHRIIEPSARRFHYISPPNKDGKYIITKIANNKENYFYTAGLREGDEIIAINGVSPKDIDSENKKKAVFESDTLHYDIIRNGKALKMLVPVDKNEIQGD